MGDHLNQWSILPLSMNANDRCLLTRHSFNINGYTVQITDLCNIWSDTLNRQEINDRATREDSSIDPSDETSQLRLLLQHLEDALCGKQGTELNVISPLLSDHEMILQSLTPLPQGLRPLTWSFYFNRAAVETIRSDLVLPLIAASYLQNQQINQLSRWLVEKDNAIAKIMDKLETSGIDLASIFPMVPMGKNKKGTQRSLVVQHVKALNPFDKHMWIKAQYPSSSRVVPFQELVNGAFEENDPEITRTVMLLANSATTTTYCSHVRNSERSQNENWLSQQQSNTDEFQRQTSPSQRRHLEARQPADIDIEPPHESASRPFLQSKASDDEETNDEDNGNTSFESVHLEGLSNEHDRGSPMTPPKEAIVAKHQTSHEHSPRKLGTLGGAKACHMSVADSLANQRAQLSHISADPKTQPKSIIGEPDQLLQEHKQSSPRKLGHFGGQATAASTLSSHDTLQGSAPRKLGSIGGRAKAQSPNPGPIHNPLLDDSLPRQTTPSASNISAPENEANNASASPENMAATPSIHEKSPAPRESSRERADRRRADLKRQLEEQNKTQTKKKRRF